jgi:cephalosporin-C deacetylase
MPQFDLPLPELLAYSPDLVEPADLDAFWRDTLARSRRHALSPRVVPAVSPIALVDSFDVTFSGYEGHPIRAWLHVPKGAAGRLPLVVQYIGYTQGRGYVHDHLEWVLAGYAHLVVDNRGQGWGGLIGDTPDPDPAAGLIAWPGHVTRGISDPQTYYYRRVFTDAVRAIDLARTLPLVDADRIVLAGTSQGGGIAIAVAALAEGIAGAMINVPFLCHFDRATVITDSEPYQEIVQYLRRHRDAATSAFETLRYFDGAVLAPRASVPALFSVALMDQTCPPSTVFAAFNRWGHEDRSIEVYPFNRHEGGQERHLLKQYEWMRQLVG